MADPFLNWIPKTWWGYPSSMNDVYSLKEASEMLHFSKDTIINQIKQKKLVGFKIDRRWYVIVKIYL
jgi:hypothetical protein